jgi:predicted O-methyltransferase YrrM
VLGGSPVQGGFDSHAAPLGSSWGSSEAPTSAERGLPGIEWNAAGQTALLEKLSFAQELSDMPREKPDALRFYLNNGWFEAGDAEVWYQLLRLKKPKRVFEIGSGHSTLLALEAIRRNQVEDPTYQCKHLCIEPYERHWLEATKIPVLRKKVEKVGIEYFSELEANDFLFIDSSHVIRPEGDVLFEYLELLPTLKAGVIVHSTTYSRPETTQTTGFLTTQYSGMSSTYSKLS